jgi:tetratricopeptide (TPR) repeat protein
MTQAAGLSGIAVLYLKLADEYTHKGKTHEADMARSGCVALVDDLLRSAPNDSALQGMNYLAAVEPLKRLGRRDEADDYCRKALTYDWMDANLLNETAWQYISQNDATLLNPQLATALAERAVQTRPDKGTIWNALGIARFRNGDFHGAVQALNKSIELRNGGDANDFFFLAMSEQCLGNTAAARGWYDKGVAWVTQSASKSAEIGRFRTEAEYVLGLPPTTNPASQQPATLPVTESTLTRARGGN